MAVQKARHIEDDIAAPNQTSELGVLDWKIAVDNPAWIDPHSRLWAQGEEWVFSSYSFVL